MLGFRDEHPKPPFIGAGLIWRPDSGMPDPIEDDRWRAGITELVPPDEHGGFERLMGNRLYRRLPLAVLTQERDLASQAELLATFADGTFSMLRDNPPL